MAAWRSNKGFTVCHVYGHGNNESSKLFWSIQKDKVGMINNSTPINVISYTDKVMRRSYSLVRFQVYFYDTTIYTVKRKDVPMHMGPGVIAK